MKIRLLTSDGQFVHEQEIPPFNAHPDVIGWGDRVFKATGGGVDGYWLYRECFAYALVPFPLPTKGPDQP